MNVEGGLFGVGDGHARQGHGEVCGTAVEAAMNTVVAVELIKGMATPWPRLEDDTHLMSTGAAPAAAPVPSPSGPHRDAARTARTARTARVRSAGPRRGAPLGGAPSRGRDLRAGTRGRPRGA
ncbi:acetamidase/formamidase family protein [Streptosporangium sandarakinum]|uniref:acetamidase/formamidase family protein n=1 Tax=Streptosporangium sandarakinum TaxID=1260955 RepID=UPI00368647EC